MASRRVRRDDDREDEFSWEDEKRRRRLGNRKKDSGPSAHRGVPEKRKKRMSKFLSGISDEDGPRRRWRDAIHDGGQDADEESDFLDLEGDLDSDANDGLRWEELEDSGLDYSRDTL